MSALNTNYLTPTGREEAWRFTPLKRLAGLHDSNTNVSENISLSATSKLPNGVELATAKAAGFPPSYTSTDVVTNRIRAEVKNISVLTIKKDMELDTPIFLSRKCGNTPELSRVLIQAGENSKSVVIIENNGTGEIGEEIEVSLASGASLDLISLQE